MVAETDKRTVYEASDAEDSSWLYLDSHPTDDPRIGVSLSGGGIRSAAFSLGAMQKLIDIGLFGRIKHLAAVSGGTYIAGAMSITNAESEKDSLVRFPWTRGSPEEKKLRLETTYLANGVRDSLWLTSNFLYGLIVNLTTLAIPMFLLGRLAALILAPIIVFSGGKYTLNPEAKITLPVLGFALIVASILIVGFRRFKDKTLSHISDDLTNNLRSINAVLWYLFLALALIIFLPIALSAIHNISNYAYDYFAEQTDPLINNFALTRILVAAILMGTFAMIGGIAIWLGRYTSKPILFSPAAMIAGPGLLFTPFVLSVDWALSNSLTLENQAPELIVASILIIIFSIVAHNRRYSLHLFYRERLQKAFGIKRSVNQSGDVEVKSIPYEQVIHLSNIGSTQQGPTTHAGEFPNVIYCASVAASRKEAPYRHNASSYTFENDWSGGPLVGYTRTSDLEKEQGAGGSAITIPSIMAISGAAVSPIMGRFSQPPLRFLMAMLNLRLGVWLPHPERKGPEILGLIDRAIRKFGEKYTSSHNTNEVEKSLSLKSKALDFIYKGWLEPGPLYVLYEALGRATARGKYVYVSDGGHWENLGFVELLRRRCDNIVIFDASAPGRKLDEELARAARLANSELGIDVVIDHTIADDFRKSSVNKSNPPNVPFIKGRIIYPDNKSGKFIFIRSVLWSEAPFELKSFQDLDSQFPHHPTRNQFFSGEQFDAYRQLGYAAAEYVRSLEIPEPKSERQTGPQIVT